MIQRIGRVLIITGLIFVIRPDVMSQTSLMQYQMKVIEYWPIALIVIGFLFLSPRNKRKSSR